MSTTPRESFSLILTGRGLDMKRKRTARNRSLGCYGGMSLAWLWLNLPEAWYRPACLLLLEVQVLRSGCQ